MKRVLITGGSGDWAQSFKQQYGNQFHIDTPGRSELDVTSEGSVKAYFAGLSAPYDIVINNHNDPTQPLGAGYGGFVGQCNYEVRRPRR